MDKKELDIKISYSCNNNCVFCLNQEKKIIKDNIILIKNTIENFALNGGEKLIISGGEPLISKNLFDLLDFSKKMGINIFEIQTNGRMFAYENIIKKLKKYGIILFLVSFHFPNENLYKKYSRSDGFDQTLKGLKNLKKNNCHFLTNTVVMKQNLFYLKDIIKTLRKIGFSSGVQYRFIDGKNVIDNYKDFVPRYKECYPIIKEIIEKNNDVNIHLREFPLCVLEKKIRVNTFIPIRMKRSNLSLLGGISSTKEIFNSQFTYPNCNNCIYKNNGCFGVRKEYIDIYGKEEFKPIIK